MSKIRVIICRVEEDEPDKLTGLGSYDMPEIDISEVSSEGILDEIEQATFEKENVILRNVVQAQWEEIDQELAREYRQRFSPSGSNE